MRLLTIIHSIVPRRGAPQRQTHLRRSDIMLPLTRAASSKRSRASAEGEAIEAAPQGAAAYKDVSDIVWAPPTVTPQFGPNGAAWPSRSQLDMRRGRSVQRL